MATDPKAIYMLKPAEDDDSVAVNRTIRVIDEDGDNFVVLVTDRDYLNDPTGQSQTIVFRESCSSIDLAIAEMQKLATSSLADGFIRNPSSEGHVPLM